MSVEAMNYTIRLKVGNVTAKFVLNRLADRADERYSCFPSVPLIAAELEVSERTVQRALDVLRALRLVSDRAQFRPDGSQTSSRYVLHGPWDSYAGTGIPFPEIVTPKQARQELWGQAPAEGEFREGTAAAVALSGDGATAEAAAKRAADTAARTSAAQESKRARGRKAAAVRGQKTASETGLKGFPAGGEGVTLMSPPPVTLMSPPPVTLMSPLPVSPMSPLEPTVTTLTTEPTAPSARSAADVRRTGAGSSAREAESGSAATGKATSSGKDSGKARVPGPRDDQADAEAAACREVEVGLPPALVALLPYGHIPKRNRKAVLEALDSRTPQQLADRAARRWLTYRYEVAFHDEGLRSPVGVALELIAPTPYCPDLSCEDGIQDGHLGGKTECTVCVMRRRDRRNARRKGLPVPTGRATRHAPIVECADCQRPLPAGSADGTVCRRCTDEAAAAFQAISDQWAADDQERADQQAAKAATLADQEQQQAAADEEQARALAERLAAEAAETARLREQVAAENPHLAAYGSGTRYPTAPAADQLLDQARAAIAAAKTRRATAAPC